MAEATSWYHGNEPGHVKASIGNAEKMAKVISRARRVLLVTGPQINDGQGLVSLIRSIPSATLVASPRTRPLLSGEQGMSPDAYMNVLEVMDRVRDPYWKGFDGAGRYDLVILLGMDYYHASQMFSIMKHFGHGVKTMSLGRQYQPNAGYSFGNLMQQSWEEEISELSKLLGGGP